MHGYCAAREAGRNALNIGLQEKSLQTYSIAYPILNLLELGYKYSSKI